MARDKWYKDGLTFECQGCGNCCSGPEEGYVWMAPEELNAMAKEVNLTPEKFKNDYCRRIGFKYSLKEKKPSNDCIFLEKRQGGGKYCEVYNTRPIQCRTWPFWKGNLASKMTWQAAASTCPGMNRGRLFNISEIEAVRDGDLTPLQKQISPDSEALEWINSNIDNKDIIDQVLDIYSDIAMYIESASASCENCGKCCDFGTFGHRLYATTLEMLVFFHFARNVKPFGSLDNDMCIYRDKAGCMLYDGRTAGCRIFYCRDLPHELQNELYEQILERLKVLHNHYNTPYYYSDVMWWLKNNSNIK